MSMVICDDNPLDRERMAIIVQAFLDGIQVFFHLSDEQINSLLASFVSRLPAYLRDSLHFVHAA